MGMRPHIQALSSVAMVPNEGWSTDFCRDLADKHGWTSLALVIDCHTRELLGSRLSRTTLDRYIIVQRERPQSGGTARGA